jgi:uncharacterized protein (DUF1778 family)
MPKPKPKRKRPARKVLKDVTIRMRVTAEHKRVLNEAAEREGLELSAWLRRAALRAAGALPVSE